MDSPLVRIIAGTLGGFFLILLILSALDWVRDAYPRRPAGPPATEQVRHPLHHQTAVVALEAFFRLPESEQSRIRQRLDAGLVPIRQWLDGLEQSKFEVLCLGEFHEEATRGFLSKKVFPGLDIDVLMLEAVPDELHGLIRRMKGGRDYFPLLDADIMGILRTATRKHPGIEIVGVEETDEQAENSHGRVNSRDRAIAGNVRAAFRPGLRHVMLLGALHCADEPDWLFHTLYRSASPAQRRGMRNVQVIGEHQSGPVEAFVYFLDRIGLEKRDFAVPGTDALPEQIRHWFPRLDRGALKRYGTLVVFRGAALTER